MSTKAQIHYFTLSDEQRKEEKLQWFSENRLKDISFENIKPDKNHNWINLADNDFESLVPLCSKDAKSGKNKEAIFELFSLGIATNRDEWVYDLNKDTLKKKIDFFSKFYETEKKRWTNSSKNIQINDFVNRVIKWTEELENYLKKGISLSFQNGRIKNIFL